MKEVAPGDIQVAYQQVVVQTVTGSEDFDAYADNIGRTLDWGVVDTWQEALARYHELRRLTQHGA